MDERDDRTLPELTGSGSVPAGGEHASGGDPWGVAAIVMGCLGILVLGILLAPLTAWISGIAGQKARAEGRSLENAYIGFVLAAIDGIAWLVLHLMFDVTFLAF